MKILFVDGVGPYGGASRSLFELLNVLIGFDVDVKFLAVKGTSYNYYSKISDDMVVLKGMTRFDNTEFSHYRGIRWLVFTRELFYFPHTIYGVIRAKNKFDNIDLIHANEITEIIPALLLKIAFNVPLVVHVRSVQNRSLNSLRNKLINYLLNKYVDLVIAIDENVKKSLTCSVQVDVVHNSYSVLNNLGDKKLKKYIAQIGNRFTVGFVGNLLESKGIYELIEAARLLKHDGLDVCFLVVGWCAKNNGIILNKLAEFIGIKQDVCFVVKRKVYEYGLNDSFLLVGASSDLNQFYSAIDVICFPSYFNAPGRPIFEAAYYSVPSILAVDSPYDDTFINNSTGLKIKSGSAHDIKNAVRYLFNNRADLERMGKNAKILNSNNFDSEKNAAIIYSLYSKLVSK